MITHTHALARLSVLDSYMHSINQYPILTPEEEITLAKKWYDEKDKNAAHSLVTANLRFVVKIANQYSGYRAKIMDLIQEGSIGLMHAVHRFNPNKGYRLLTFAVHWIRAYIHSFLMRTTSIIKLGTSRAHRKLFFKLRSMKAALLTGGDKTPDEVIDIVADKTGVKRDDVVRMDQYLSRKETSLDKPLKESGLALVEIFPSDEKNPEDIFANLETKANMAAKLETSMQKLDSREKEIIEKRFFLDPPVQLKDIGSKMNITKQRVAQLEKRALKKIRSSIAV